MQKAATAAAAARRAPAASDANRCPSAAADDAKLEQEPDAPVIDLCNESPKQHSKKQQLAEPATRSSDAVGAGTDDQPLPPPQSLPVAVTPARPAGPADEVLQSPDPLAQTQPCTPLSAKGTADTPGGAQPPATGGKAGEVAILTPEQRAQLLEACLQELPLLEAELDARPDLCRTDALAAHAQAMAGVGEFGGAQQLQAPRSGKQTATPTNTVHDIKQLVSLLVEGQAAPLSELVVSIAAALGSSSSCSGQQEQQQPPASSGGAGAGGMSALALRNLIQDIASRRSYGLQDGAAL